MIDLVRYGAYSAGMSNWAVGSPGGDPYYDYEISWKGVKLITEGFTVPFLAIMLGDSKGFARKLAASFKRDANLPVHAGALSLQSKVWLGIYESNELVEWLRVVR